MAKLEIAYFETGKLESNIERTQMLVWVEETVDPSLCPGTLLFSAQMSVEASKLMPGYAEHMIVLWHPLDPYLDIFIESILAGAVQQKSMSVTILMPKHLEERFSKKPVSRLRIRDNEITPAISAIKDSELQKVILVFVSESWVSKSFEEMKDVQYA